MKRINIAIDGPSGAGKSSISKKVAAALGYTHLDTGGMYRAVAYKCFDTGLGVTEDVEDRIVDMISKMDLDMKVDGSIFLDGKDVSQLIRTDKISMGASDVSKLKGVRAALVKKQQEIASKKGYVLDGRDICSVVLPDAELKIFFTASPEERARRRVYQNSKNGIESNFDEILEEIKKRDYQDSHRENSPLIQTEDSVYLDTSDMTREEVVNKILELANEAGK